MGDVPASPGGGRLVGHAELVIALPDAAAAAASGVAAPADRLDVLGWRVRLRLLDLDEDRSDVVLAAVLVRAGDELAACLTDVGSAADDREDLLVVDHA